MSFQNPAKFVLSSSDDAALDTGSPYSVRSVDHMVPAAGFAFPEGFDLGAALAHAIDGHFPVLEIGCGAGRIASLFDDGYIGVDDNPHSIAQARTALPGQKFRLHDKGDQYPEAATALFYTALLHVSDEALGSLLVNAVRGRKRVVIAELMDVRWRDEGSSPAFNRDPEFYIFLMQELGFKLVHYAKPEAAQYSHAPWNIGRDSRITFLAFEKVAQSVSDDNARTALPAIAENGIRRAGDMWVRAEDPAIGCDFEISSHPFAIDHLNVALRHCDRRRVALDIGANYGSASRYLSRQFDRVLAFEPVRATFECTRRNLAGFSNVELENQAVGDRVGMVTVADAAGDIEMIRIDDLGLEAVDFIRLAAEGFELGVLKGAEETLRRCKPVVILEGRVRGSLEHDVAGGECAALLEALGAQRLAVEGKDFIVGWPEQD